MTKGETAVNYFKQGLNCAQSVVAAFSEEMNLSEDTAIQLATGFGAGMGRMREVCGAVSGMTFVISALYNEDKGSVYKRVQDVANEFKDKNGSIVCRELLGLSIKGADSPVPEKRTEQYYKKRPCVELVEMATNTLEKYIKNNPVQTTKNEKSLAFYLLMCYIIKAQKLVP